MKKIFTVFAALACVMSMSAVTYNVTVPAGTKACYIAGEMNSWSFTEMTKVDDTHYTLELADATETMKYKYCSGPGWAYVEKTAAGEEVADRTYFVEDVVENWASVYEPSATPEEPGTAKDITIKAKMPAGTGEPISAWVWPTGGNGEWKSLTKEGDWYVYTATQVTEVNIIFIEGTSWDNKKWQTVDLIAKENVCWQIEIPATGNYTATNIDCEDGDNPGEDPIEPTLGVTYNVTVPAGTKACYIAGELNGWSHTEMTKVDETHYTLTVADATTAMKYKYCSGPGWEYVEKTADGEEVADRTYSENDVVETWLAVYDPNGETPVDPIVGVTYNVTVPAGTKACYIAGELNGWSHTEMIKVDETHYTLTVADATTAMKYKYCSGPGWEYVEKDANGEEIADRTYSENDVVATWLAVYEPTTTAVDNIATEKKAVKVIRDGQMFIIRDNVMYSVLGQMVK